MLARRSQVPAVASALRLALALALAAGCGRCGEEAVAPPQRWLPAESRGALLLPRLADAAAALGLLARSAATVPAAGGAIEAWGSVKAQLGFDPLDPEALRGIGLDPGRGAGAALGAAGLLVLPVTDAARLDGVLARLARDRLGAGLRDEGREGGAAVVRFRRAADQAPALAYAPVPGAVILSTDPAAAGAAAARAVSASLAASPAFGALGSALGDGLLAVVYLPASRELAEAAGPLRDGAALALRSSPGGLQLRIALALPGERAEVWSEVAGGPGAARAGAEELGALPAGLFAAARFGGDPAALGRRIGYALPAELGARLARAGLDLQRDLFAHLEPGAALGLSLAPGFDARAAAGGMAAAARDPFRLVRLAAVARVKDPAALGAALERLARQGPALGLRVTSRPLGAGRSWSLAVGGGQLAWALDGPRLLLAGGAGGVEALRGLGPGYAAPTPSSRATLAAGGAALAVDVAGLVGSLRALPQEAFGTGPDGFVARSLLDRFLEPASRLSALSASLQVLPGTARLDVEVEAAPP